MKIAVINLLRLGDLLQSAPLLYNLKIQKGGTVTLIAAKEDAFLLKRLEIVDEVLLFKPVKLSTDNDLFKQYEIADELLKDFSSAEFDWVIVLNSLSVAYCLAEFIVKDSQNIIGSVYHNYKLGPDRIFKYLYALAENRSLSLINLSELYLGYLPKLPEQFYHKIRKSIVKDKSARPIVVINTSTGEAVRNFSASFFAGVIDILANDYSVQLVGTDDNISQQISQLAKSDYTNFINQTSLDQLAELLANADIFISADTGSIHLAALCGTKILGLYNISAYHHLTGAYSPTAWYLTPEINCYPCEEHYQPCGNLQCRNFYTPQAINVAIETILHNKSEQPLQNLNFSRSIIDQDGCFVQILNGNELIQEAQNIRLAAKILLFNHQTTKLPQPIDLWWEQFVRIVGKIDGDLNSDLSRFLKDNPRYKFLSDLCK